MDKFYFVQIQLHGTVTCDFIICMPATHWSVFVSVSGADPAVKFDRCSKMGVVQGPHPLSELE